MSGKAHAFIESAAIILHPVLPAFISATASCGAMVPSATYAANSRRDFDIHIGVFVKPCCDSLQIFRVVGQVRADEICFWMSFDDSVPCR